MGTMIEYGDHQRGYIAEPASEPIGGLIVIHEVWGLVEHIEDVADRFASEGYVALAPDLLSGSDIDADEARSLQNDLFDPRKRNEAQPRLRELMAPLQSPEFARKATAGVQQAFEHLAGLPGTDGRVGVVGYCFGGTYAFTLAAVEPRLTAAIAYYGHAALGEEDAAAIRCPVLAFYGEEDERLMSELPELKLMMGNTGADFDAVTYPGAGHAFFNDSNPYAYVEEAARDAWRRTLDFLGANVSKS